MNVIVIQMVKRDPNLYQYLRENSYWYKYLNRDEKNLKLMEEEMKKKYKLTPEDKLEKISNRIQLISSFMDVLK